MRTKRVVIVCCITFFVGMIGGGAYAYTTNSDDSQGLALKLEQAQENWEVEQFINEQEKLRPDGMGESKIATGSKYTGITYNGGKSNQSQNTDNYQNVTPANVGGDNTPKEEKTGLLGKLFGEKENDVQGEQPSSTGSDGADQTKQGRVSIHEGSLNVRAQSNTSSEIIGQVYKDNLVQILGSEGSWYRIVTADGTEGYVSAAYVEIIDAAE